MVEIEGPEGEADLLLLRSVFDAAGILYFVKGDLFGSLTVGPRIDHYNRKVIYVHAGHADDARALVVEFRSKTAAPPDAPAPAPTPWNVLRMVLEVLFFGWFMPGRRSRSSPRHRLRIVRGGRDDAADPPSG